MAIVIFLGIILFSYFVLYYALIFTAGIAKFCPKPSRHENCVDFEVTGNFWLAVFSPFHELDSSFIESDQSSLWYELRWVLYLAIAFVVFYPSVAVVAAWAMLSNGWGFISSTMKKLVSYITNLGSAIR